MTEWTASDVLSTYGASSDPTLVFLHGSGNARNVWLPHVDVLADEYHCVTVDFPGHGSHPVAGFSYDKAVGTIGRVLEQVGPAALVGHSMGGYAAMMAAEDYEDQITGLCLAGSATNWWSRDILLSPLPALQLLTSWAVQVGRHSDRLRAWHNDTFNSKLEEEQIPPEEPHDPLLGVAHEMRRPGLKRTWPGATGFDGPVYVVYGNDESRIEHARRLADACDGEFYEMAAEGHGAPVIAPDEFVEIVRDFAADVYNSGSRPSAT